MVEMYTSLKDVVSNALMFETHSRNSPNGVVIIVQCVVLLQLLLELWNIVENKQSSRQVCESSDNSENREKSAASVHVEEEAAGGHTWDATEKKLKEVIIENGGFSVQSWSFLFWKLGEKGSGDFQRQTWY